MSDDRALLKAIAANPDEDTPRLAYADWLDENKADAVPSPSRGPSARAEFIRVQCRLAAAGADDPDYPELLERRRDLEDWLETHDPGAPPDLGGLSRGGGAGAGDWSDSRRGFDEVFTFDDYGDSADQTVDELASALEAAFRTSPGRSLMLEDAMAEEVALLSEHPAFRQIRGLYLDGLYEGDEDQVAEAIAGSPQSAGLRRLFFNRLRLEDNGCRALAESRYLTNLESFGIDYPVPIRALKRFQGVKWFRNLRRLHLWSGSGDLLRALADFPAMPRLTSLTVNGALAPNATTVRRFASAETFPRLSHLELLRPELQPEHFAILARARWPLRHLALDRAVVRKAGCEALAGAAFARTLRVLELRGCEVTAGGVQALAESGALAGLRHLRLSDNPVGPGGLAAIAASGTLRGLRVLDLNRTNMAKGPVAARHVVEFLSSLQMPDLRHLMLSGLPVAVRGARVLASSPTFAGLTRLELDSCSLGERGTAALAESETLTNLVALELFGNRVGSGAGKLANPKVFPRLGYCRLGWGVSRKMMARLGRRPGVRA